MRLRQRIDQSRFPQFSRTWSKSHKMSQNGTDQKSSKRLSPGMERGISALLTHHNVSDAATAAGITRRTLWRWLQDEEFLKAYRAEQNTVISSATSMLLAASAQAVEVLIKNLTCGDPRAEISAAKAILQIAGEHMEKVEIIDRLVKLEKIAKKNNLRPV